MPESEKSQLVPYSQGGSPVCLDIQLKTGKYKYRGMDDSVPRTRIMSIPYVCNSEHSEALSHKIYCRTVLSTLRSEPVLELPRGPSDS